MRRSVSHVSRRGGFTLVELLVVITIIAILFALLSAAAVKLIGKGDDVKLRSEISQLSQAVQAFKQQFAVGYVPDQIMLPPGLDPSGFSAQYVKSVWPRLNASAVSGTTTAFSINGINYPRGVLDYWGVPGNQAVILQGDQSLVFWLGGPRDVVSATTPGNVLGFCADPTDPMNRTSNKRVTTFYEFPSDRLMMLPTNTARTAPFPSFRDIFGVSPYIYFATGKSDNNYLHTVAFTPSSGVSPYKLADSPPSPTVRFANPSSFQIVSAGRDGVFGPGGLAWAGAVGGAATQDGNDDVANFHPTFLGVPNQ